MRVLVISKIFPNVVEPLSSPFNRQQFAALSQLADVRVLATIPWLPFGKLARVPAAWSCDGLVVQHPRYFFVPKIGHAIAPALYWASLLSAVRAEVKRGVDVILGSWAYPDGAAAILLGMTFRLPVVVKLHGSDINVVAKMRGPREVLKRLLPRASRVVAVSEPLKRSVIDLGVAESRVTVIRNGVDQSLFHVRDARATRRQLDLIEGRWIVYAGRLEREKGLYELLDAFARISVDKPGARLALVGDGREKNSLQARASELGLGEKVLFVGAVPLHDVPLWFAAAHVVTLPSYAEGTPNVILEALACGRRVVATRVGGIPDLITNDSLGALVPPRRVPELASALSRTLESDYDAAEVARAGASSSWEKSAAALHDVLAKAIAESR